MARINKESIDRLYDYDIHVESRTVYMGSTEVDLDGNESGTDPKMAERIIKALHLLDQKNEPITIIMNNPGGDWYAGMAIYDAIRACQSEITIKVFGMAMSMGAIILQSADNRVLTTNSKVMIHYGFAGMEGHTKTFQKWAEEYKKIDNEMEIILLDKIKEKHPTFTLDQLKNLLDHDTILSAKEAINLGLADEIL